MKPILSGRLTIDESPRGDGCKYFVDGIVKPLICQRIFGRSFPVAKTAKTIDVSLYPKDHPAGKIVRFKNCKYSLSSRSKISGRLSRFLINLLLDNNLITSYGDNDIVCTYKVVVEKVD